MLDVRDGLSADYSSAHVTSRTMLIFELLFDEMQPIVAKIYYVLLVW